MTRHFQDWLPAYLEYTAGTEAPRIMHFWAGVSCLAACLRRKVWIDMKRFQWFPNFYIIFVAKPGIISKTTTMDMGMELVKRVPGIKFGPDVVTWQALVTRFTEAQEDFEFDGAFWPMSPLTLASGELGNLLNPQDRDMVNLFIALWDGRKSFEKITKGSGNDTVSAPWINMVACTTPHWIADNMPAATVGGGFTSRCVFVYADKKENFIAYPDEHTRSDHAAFGDKLVADLEHIATNLVGPYEIDEKAREWGREWYKALWAQNNSGMDNDRVDGYLARKQTHMHKLALVLAVSRGDEPRITEIDLRAADAMLQQTEKNLDKVFSRIGRTEESLQVERFVHFMMQKKKVKYTEAYMHIHSYFPDFREWDGMIRGLIATGQLKMAYEGNGTTPEFCWLIYTGA